MVPFWPTLYIHKYDKRTEGRLLLYEHILSQQSVPLVISAMSLKLQKVVEHANTIAVIFKHSFSTKSK